MDAAYLQLLRDHSRHLAIRMSADSIALPTELAAIAEVNYPNYLPARNLAWQATPPDQIGGELHLATSATFHRRGGDQAATVNALYVTLERPGQAPALVTVANLSAPITLVAPASSVLIEMVLQGAELQQDPEPRFAVVLTPRVQQFGGGGPLYALAGTDRSNLQTLRDTLSWALSRDSRLDDLTNRSTRSRLPFVPTGDEQLARAVTLLQARLRTMLADD